MDTREDSFIPSTLDELSPDFLTQALRRAGVLPTGRVASCKPERIGEGYGFACQVARVHLEYDSADPSSPRTVIAKLPTPNRKNRSAVEVAQGYEREVCFFRELAERSRLAVPRCYYAGMDPDPCYERRPGGQRLLERLPVWAFRLVIPLARWFFGVSKRRYRVLLEDLAPARTLDQVAGCGLADAERAIRGLAAFHASYWADESLAEKIWLPPANTLVRAIMGLHRSTRRRFYRRHGGAIPPLMKETCRWMDAHCEAAMRHLASPPLTVVHGDFRLDNLFFDGERMWAADFQVATRARPGMDLAYFVMGSVDPSVDEGVLLDSYCEELTAQGVAEYSREECERDYTLAKFFQAYLHTASYDDFFDLGEGRGRALMDAMRARLFARLPEPPYDGLL